MAKRPRGLAYRLLRGALLLFVGWLAAMAASVVALRWIDPPTSAFMLRDQVEAIVTREPGYQFRHEWRDLNAISKYAAVAVIAAEDQAFPQPRRLRLQTDRPRARGPGAGPTHSRREHDHATGREEPVPLARPELVSQGTRGRPDRPDRGELEQATHPRDLSQHRRVRPRHLGRRGGEPPLFPQGRRSAHPLRRSAARRRAPEPAPDAGRCTIRVRSSAPAGNTAADGVDRRPRGAAPTRRLTALSVKWNPVDTWQDRRAD